MSYEIVKNCTVKELPTGYVATLTTACNNVHPRYYSEWNYGEGKFWDKETLEKNLLWDFYNGNLQRGNSKYRRAIDDATTLHSDLLKKARRISSINDKIWHKSSATSNFLYNMKKVAKEQPSKVENKEGYEAMVNKLENRIAILQGRYKKLDEAYEEEVKAVLYTFLHSKTKQIKGIVLQDKHSGEYVSKILKRIYYTSFKRKMLTSPNAIRRVLTNDWWNKNFNIEVVR